MSNPKSYWDGRFSTPGFEGVEHHANQNSQITADFMAAIVEGGPIDTALKRAKCVLEVGCGTGEMLAAIQARYRCMCSGVDISDSAIVRARTTFRGCHWTALDATKPGVLKMMGPFDFVLSSNVVEHFKKPQAFVDGLFEGGPLVCILAPYNQQKLDGYDAEGGAGHASTINLDTFTPWRVLEHFTFKTDGWQHRAEGDPEPLQLCVLLEMR